MQVCFLLLGPTGQLEAGEITRCPQDVSLSQNVTMQLSCHICLVQLGGSQLSGDKNPPQFQLSSQERTYKGTQTHHLCKLTRSTWGLPTALPLLQHYRQGVGPGPGEEHFISKQKKDLCGLQAPLYCFSTADTSGTRKEVNDSRLQTSEPQRGPRSSSFPC